MGWYDHLRSFKTATNMNEYKRYVHDSLNEETDFSHDWEILDKNLLFDGNTIGRYVNLINEITN